MSRRRICYITGTRADFGLMRSTLQLIAQSDLLDLSILATAMHLSHLHGDTLGEIGGDGLPQPLIVPIEQGAPSGALMARNVGQMIEHFVGSFEELRPDIVLLLGDRGEMLAGAIAALHLNIHIAHIHGGERSGTVDEPVRHAISKMSHMHLVASEESADRLRKMGERASDIHVVGAPGLDGLVDLATDDRRSLARELGFDPNRPVALFVLHPVVQEAHLAGVQAQMALNALAETDLQVVALRANSDAGGDIVNTVLERAASQDKIILRAHMKRGSFVSTMKAADLMIGNSSSGIIEAATFSTPVVNLGLRQNLRQRNHNVVDASFTPESIRAAIRRALKIGRQPAENVYGDGRAAERILKVLLAPPDPDQLMKSNAY
ncbi:UDP-N-acetylglucosamine 2-epimerase [Devosia sp. Root635]|uniref:UDP-N-acetylglucosamine 2-epimerase n=1 Tax=Devosia sp. Root635 TaxID=1736575 RepID=UPI0006F78BEE|nr:UDP-N-acetylglucosamine 2-epimerase [Devosia sp. Root635]KRA55358.1 UDP-N-acetyl glucosamine 2-epimerase [Devosia sp. Root635]